MKLEKAIELLQDLDRGLDAKSLPDHSDAVKLGIEALKFTLAVRGTILLYATLLLPGETHD